MLKAFEENQIKQGSKLMQESVLNLVEKIVGKIELAGHDGPVSLHWVIREIPSYQTLQYLGTGLKHKTPKKD